MHQHSTGEQLLEELEHRWKLGQMPDVLEYLQRLAPNESDDLLADFAITDMQWHWRSGLRSVKCTAEYLRMMPRSLHPAAAARILCHEFAERNRHGDCPTRRDLCDEYPELHEYFLKLVNSEIRDSVEWPEVVLRHEPDLLLRVPLDRPVSAGRQATSEERPWSVITGAFEHQIVLCEMFDPRLSRKQLYFRLIAPNTVQIRNCSTSRAIRIRGGTPLDHGTTANYGLNRPVTVHLFGLSTISIVAPASHQPTPP
jgi:hypothetical protein